MVRKCRKLKLITLSILIVQTSSYHTALMTSFLLYQQSSMYWKCFYNFTLVYHTWSRSQWPSGLRRGSAAGRLLRLRVRIPPGAWTFVCCKCCQVKISATDWSLVQRSPTDCGVCHCVWSRNLENEEAKTRKWVVKASSRRRRIWHLE